MPAFSGTARSVATVGGAFLLALSGTAVAEEEAAAEEGGIDEVRMFESPVGGRFIVLTEDLRCAQTSKGEVYCFGDQEVPRKVAGVRYPRKARGVGSSACFLDRRGRIGCVGPFSTLLTGLRLTDEERGARDEPKEEAPKDVKASDPLAVSFWGAGASDFDMGHEVQSAHLCIIKAGSVQCMGFNQHGQLGDGTRTSRVEFQPVKDQRGKRLDGVRNLNLTGVRSCAVKFDGELLCWGRNHPVDQARAYHGPKRYTVATKVPLAFPVAAMGEQCLISKNGQEYCWPILDEKTEKLSYVPLARDRCQLQPKTFGQVCVLERGGMLNCKREGAIFKRRVSSRVLVAENYGDLCIADGATLGCIDSYAESKNMRALGFTRVTSSSKRCRGEGPREDPPAFPAHPYVKVTATKLHGPFSDSGTRSTTLNRQQIANLSKVASSPRTYTNMATCHEPRLLFEYVDEDGEVVGYLSGSGCSTLEISRGAPAKLFSRGNVVTSWAKNKMDAVEKSLVWR